MHNKPFIYISPGISKEDTIMQALAYAKESGEGVIIGNKPIKNTKLVCFDMDATLIKIEILDTLAQIMGIGNQMQEITRQTMNGNIDFAISFSKRINMLKGLKVADLHNLAHNMPIANGLAPLILGLKQKGIKTAIATGNFSCFGEFLQNKFGFDYLLSSLPDTIENGSVLSGKIKDKIIDANTKADFLNKICLQNGFSTNDVIAVGDGANDIPMMKIAGTAIAYNAITAKRDINFLDELYASDF